MKMFKTPSRILSEELDKINNNELKQIQENINFIINKKGYGKKYYRRKRRTHKIKSFFHIFKKKELEHD